MTVPAKWIGVDGAVWAVPIFRRNIPRNAS
jgi:hypothetical protein